MPRSKIIISLGFFIALLPTLGFPQAWEAFFQVAAGLTIVFLSVLINIDRRLTLKAKAQKRQGRKRVLSQVENEESIIRAPIEDAETQGESQPFNEESQV